jgi:hypothetical protein
MQERKNPASRLSRLTLGLASLLSFVGAADAQIEGGDDQDGRTVARPVFALDHHMLRTVCLDLLGRPPLPEEREAWSDKDLRDFLKETTSGREFWNHWLEEQLYFFLLIDNFRPVNEGVQMVPKKMFEGRLNPREAVHRIVLSPSFEMRNPGADTFVTVVMEQLAGMRVQKKLRDLEIGKALYDGKPGTFLEHRGDSQADVVKICVESKEFAREFVAREYTRMVHRDGSKKSLATWSRTFHKEPAVYRELVRGWFTSEGYMTRLKEQHPLSNRAFVNALHVDLLGRMPTREEAEPMREALDGLGDSAPLRSILARLLLDSGRVTIPSKAELTSRRDWATSLFPRFFGREGTTAELDAVCGALDEPSCKPSTILYALLSHPEYHRF